MKPPTEIDRPFRISLLPGFCERPATSIAARQGIFRWCSSRSRPILSIMAFFISRLSAIFLFLHVAAPAIFADEQDGTPAEGQKENSPEKAPDLSDIEPPSYLSERKKKVGLVKMQENSQVLYEL